MKKFLIVVFTIVSSIFLSIGQTADNISHNQNFNDALYIYQKVWYRLESRGAKKITLYDTDGNISKTLYFHSLAYGRDVYMDKFVYTMYEIDVPITKIVIDNYTIKSVNSHIGTDLNTTVLNCLNEQINYCAGIKTVSHNYGKETSYDRYVRHNITSDAIVGENLAYFFKSGNERMNIRRILLAYYESRNKTGHWGAFMNKSYRYFTSVMVHGKSDEDHNYSITFFSINKTDKY